jgi:hypothetical protein
MNNTSRTPPKLATAILNRLVPAHDALAGDLREAYVAGKSRSWYWGQVLAVVWRTALNVGRPSFWWSAAAVTAAFLVLDVPFLVHSPVPFDPLRWVLMALYLAPQAAVISLPVGLTTGMVIGAPGRVSPRILPTVLVFALFIALATFAIGGWVVPASNQAYRVVVAGPHVLKGASELNVVELHSLMGTSSDSVFAVAPLSDQWDVATNYYAKFAVSCSPIVFGLFGVWAATLGRVTRRLLVVTTASAYLALFLSVEPERLGAVPPFIVAWFPTLSIAAVALLVRWRSQFRHA